MMILQHRPNLDYHHVDKHEIRFCNNNKFHSSLDLRSVFDTIKSLILNIPGHQALLGASSIIKSSSNTNERYGPFQTFGKVHNS